MLHTGSPPPSRLTPSTTPNSPAAAISAPTTSQGPVPSPFDSGSSSRPTGRLTSINGMLTRKTEPHQKCSRRKPPSSGPTAAPTAATALQMPMASARSRRSGKTCRRIDKVAGMIIAPPTPSSARAAMSTWALSARAAMAEATPNSAYPRSRIRLRPTRSPSVPNRISSEAQTSG